MPSPDALTLPAPRSPRIDDGRDGWLGRAGSLAPVSLPHFTPGSDPGPSFLELLARNGASPRWADASAPGAPIEHTHGTTVVAIRYADGVVMAGDRRATSGNLISHRTMEKVFPADRHSGVAIAGAAGPAMEMVKLFQLQLEHYEKVEGQVLSLEGKANQLGVMVRNHLPAAMQGMVVVPLFAGYDTRRQRGRLFQYDVTGGRYEEADYAATGSGSLHAGTVVKLGFREELDRAATVDLALSALWQAADEDSATGGPDLVRGIFPVMATITGTGFDLVPEDEIRTRFEELIDRLRTAEGTTYAGGTPQMGPDGAAGGDRP
jgi:proteasome beta subunit